MDCRRRDQLHTLYEATGRAAVLKTARLVGRVDVAEEIVQSAFLKLWDAQMAFASERAAYAWIYQTCHNAGIDYLRAHATRFELADDGAVIERGPALTTAFDAVAERQWLSQRLARLEEREAQVLAYRVIDGMTQAEIAEVMGVARKTVVRICERIEAKLGDEEGRQS